jgi:hypothetical protein
MKSTPWIYVKQHHALLDVAGEELQRVQVPSRFTHDVVRRPGDGVLVGLMRGC